MRTQIRSLKVQKALNQEEALRDDGMAQQICTLKELEVTLRKEKAELERFFLWQDELDECRRKTFQTAVNVAGVQQELKAADKQQLTSLILRTYFVIPALMRKVLNEADRLHIKTSIDAKMVDLVIQEELDNEAKAKAAIERGKSALLARSNY